MRRPNPAPRSPLLIVLEVALAGLLGVVSGCGLSNGTDEYVVHFTPGTVPSVARAVGHACPGVGKATLEPPDRNHLATSRAYPVRYDITNASSKDKAELLTCLKKQPTVRGVSESNDEA